MRRAFSVIALFLTGAWSSATLAQGIRWAGAVDNGHFNVLHAPDDRFAPASPALRLSDFTPVFSYPNLRSLLRISEKDWARADIIAFEGNGGHGAGVEGGWESSKWTFMDGTRTVVVEFNERIGRKSHPSIIATGSVIGADGTVLSGGDAYRRHFGICSSNPANKVVSFILFDLDAAVPRVNPTAAGFTIQLQNGHKSDGSFGEGTPDPDAVGVIASCPLLKK